MKDNYGNEFLNTLIGEKLSSVTFVLDYLQLDFDGNRLTISVWPMVEVKNLVYRFGESSYRDSLCSLIGQVVIEAIAEEELHLSITFESGDKLTVSLDPTSLEVTGPEIAVFTDVNDEFYVLG